MIFFCTGLIRLLIFTRPWLRLPLPVACRRAFGIGRPAPPPQSTAISLGSSVAFLAGFGFCGRTIPSRREQGVPIPEDDFPNELAHV